MISHLPIGELAALGAAACWTLGPLIATRVVREIGAVRFSRVRSGMFFVLTLLIGLIGGSWAGLSWEAVAWLAASGVVGVAIGDVFLFASYKMVGPRLGSLLYMTSAPYTVVLAWGFLGETLAGQALAGGALTLAGICIALLRRETEAKGFGLEADGMLKGVLFGLIAAAAQAAGTLLSKPALLLGVDPLTAAPIRTGAAMLAIALVTLPTAGFSAYRMPLRLMPWTLLQACFGSTGVILLLIAIGTTSAGIAAILASLPPIIMLPILRFGFGARISALSWIATFTAFVGVVLILSR